MILHVLNASPASSAFRNCVNVMESGDALVLMGESVYAALEGTPAHEVILMSGARIHVLRNHATAAGLPLSSGSIEVIDIEGFVALTERFSRQICWY